MTSESTQKSLIVTMLNPFSEPIAFRPEGPIKLLDIVPLDILEPDGPGAILLEEKALIILRNIKEPITVIAVGKSFTLLLFVFS